MVLKEKRWMCSSELLKRDWWRILFLTFDSFTDLGGNQAEKEPVVRKSNSRGKGRERGERECNVNGLRKERAMYMTKCH